METLKKIAAKVWTAVKKVDQVVSSYVNQLCQLPVLKEVSDAIYGILRRAI